MNFCEEREQKHVSIQINRHRSFWHHLKQKGDPILYMERLMIPSPSRKAMHFIKQREEENSAHKRKLVENVSWGRERKRRKISPTPQPN